MSLPIRILLIDESTERAVTLTHILNGCGYYEIAVCSPVDSVMDIVIENNPHVILIDVHSPTRDTLEQLTTIRDEHPTPVVLLSPDNDIQSIESAFKCGVTAYVSDDISSSQAKPIIDTAMLTFASFQKLNTKLEESELKLENQKIIQRAKGILMSKLKITEEQAYQKLRRYAMNEKRSMADLAKQIIEVNSIIS